MRNPRLCVFAALATLAACSSNSSAQARDQVIISKLKKDGCNSRIQIIRTIPDTLNPGTACLLATAALNFIGGGGAKSIAVRATDTSQMTRAIVTSNAVSSPDAPTDYYWDIGFDLPARNMSVSVRIDRRTGAFDAKLAEPIRR